ncbi:Ger(x)C family spore germination protein [Virgibacillus byunsanensis]|uniref:Ger(X)C family spore germination protein n=1 Tax=Virgibacillus byunsanensis TaxID=570945 RepID=A0ABW3LEW2_9BACI
MRQKLIPIITLIVLIIILSGCWSRTELDEMAIATAIGIDKREEDYLVTVQILNPGEIAGKAVTTRSEVVTYRTTGKTLFEALRKLTTEIPRKIYVAHVRIIIFGEELAKEGIGKSLDLISRDHEFRTDFFILVAKDIESTEVLNVLTPIEKIPANKIYGSLQASEETWATTKAVTLDELITNLTSPGSNPVLSGVEMIGDSQIGMDIGNVEKVDPPASLNLMGLSVFKKDKLVGWLSQEESKGYNFIKGNVKSTVDYVACEEGTIAIEVIKTTSDVKGKVENGLPKIDIQINAEANIGEVQCGKDITKPEIIKELEQQFSDKTKKLINNSIKKVQEDFQSDIFGFGEAIHRSNSKAWKDLKENWDQEFSNVEVSVKVKYEIRRIGTTKESFQDEKEE